MTPVASVQAPRLNDRKDKLSSVGKLWTEEDFHCMKMDYFCGDIADSLGVAAQEGRLRIFHNWYKTWQQDQQVGPRGHPMLEEQLKRK
jgi:hypothetical protein